jgi:hypothetical protein
VELVALETLVAQPRPKKGDAVRVRAPLRGARFLAVRPRHLYFLHLPNGRMYPTTLEGLERAMRVLAKSRALVLFSYSFPSGRGIACNTEVRRSSLEGRKR